MNIETRNIIGFEFSKGLENTFQGINPVSNTSIEEAFFIASELDVNNALEKAKVAFKEFSTLSWDQRAAFLEEIAIQIEATGDLLIERASMETGLPSTRIIGERGRTTGQLRMFASFIRQGEWVEATIETALPTREPIPKPDLRKMLKAIGPVVVFGSSNFPLAYSVAGGDTAAALAAGCPVVVKAHPAHPGTSAIVGMAIYKAAQITQMPEGVFSMLYSNEFTVGQSLVTHENTAAVGFTGSVSGGRVLFNIAANRKSPIPVFAEMGSTNPVILLPQILGENSDTISNQYADSIALGVGQFCTNPGLLFGLRGTSLDSFKIQLAEKLATKKPATMLHKGIALAYQTNSSKMLNQQGVQQIVQVNNNVESGTGQPILAIAPGKAFLKNPSLHEEVFGPFSLLIECTDFDELLACINAMHGQLTGTIIGLDKELEDRKDLVDALLAKVGRLIFNGVPTGVEVCRAMQHGGPYPATTDSRFTAVGVDSIKRFLRPIAFQNTPDFLLPKALQKNNPLHIERMVNGNRTVNPA